MKKISVGILGATSYTGVELVKLLSRHPKADVVLVSSQSYAGKSFSSIFGEAKGICDEVLLSPEEALAADVQMDCVFSCLPHAISAKLLLPFVKQGIRVIDLSADFRLKDLAQYKKWYETDHPCANLLKEAVYGLPEHYREAIKKTNILANPGCYPTSILLPTIPLLHDPKTWIEGLIADSKSGVSGAGRALRITSHFVEANENFMAYSIGRTHRHVSEIDQELSAASGKTMTVTFSPHLVPMNRGILSTLYIRTNKSAKQCTEIVKAAYAKEPFVRVREADDLPKIRYVAGTNFCDIAFTGGGDGEPVIAVSVIDNLLKGASGQALQNMNIMFGFDETLGLL